jgi:hypothetical protein
VYPGTPELDEATAVEPAVVDGVDVVVPAEVVDAGGAAAVGGVVVVVGVGAVAVGEGAVVAGGGVAVVGGGAAVVGGGV